MKRVLFDTNIILDITLKRKEYFEHSAEVFGLIDTNEIEGYITATTITDIYYISSKSKDKQTARRLLLDLIGVVNIIGIDKEVINEALQSRISDFEDAIQDRGATLNEIEIIITRNKKDFKSSDLKIFTPLEFLEFMGTFK